MRLLLLILTVGHLCAQADWLPNAYKIEAAKYYDKLDSAQWADVNWHIEKLGIRSAVFAGMEGSNRPRGKHPTESSYQCVGVYYYTAKLYRPVRGLRDSLLSHGYTARLAAEIDSTKLAGHRKRYLETNHKWRAKRPTLNATMAYPGGKFWRNRLIYGMVHEARCRELEKRLKVGRDSMDGIITRS